MSKRNPIVMSLALAAAAISLPAAAQSRAFEPGPYIGAGFGQSHVSGGNNSVTTAAGTFSASGFDDNKTTFEVNGGYQFTEMWGIEVQYTDFGSRSGTIRGPAGFSTGTPDVKAYQWGISGTGTYMFTPEWFARGKLGVSSNHIDNFNIAVPGGSVQVGGGNKTDVLAGIGVGYKWSQNFSTRLEYEYFGKFEAANGNSSNGNISQWGLRMQYKF